MTILINDHLGHSGGLWHYTQNMIKSLEPLRGNIILCSGDDDGRYARESILHPIYAESSNKSRKNFSRLAYFLFALFNLILICMKNRPKVSVTNVFHFSAPEIIMVFVLYVLSKRLCVTIHDLEDLHLKKSRLWRFLFFKLLGSRPTVYLLTHSMEVKNEIINNTGIPCNFFPHLDFMANAPDEEILAASLKTANVDFLMFGRMKKSKGHWDFLEALINLDKEGINYKAIIAGKFDFDDYLEFKEKSSDLVKSGKLELINDFVNDDDLIDLILRSRWVVLPYQNIYSSGVLLRSIQFLRPQIHTSLGGFLDVTEGHEVSLKFDVGDSSEFFLQMQKALEVNVLSYHYSVSKLKNKLVNSNNIELFPCLLQIFKF
jgi:D-inositol-3-phosphate glycosyltransferase